MREYPENKEERIRKRKKKESKNEHRQVQERVVRELPMAPPSEKRGKDIDIRQKRCSDAERHEGRRKRRAYPFMDADSEQYSDSYIKRHTMAKESVLRLL